MLVHIGNSMRSNKLEPIENWHGYNKYKQASRCLISLEILFIKNIFNSIEEIKNSLKKCIKLHQKVSNLKKINESLRSTIIVQLKALLILDYIFKLSKLDLDKLQNQRMLKKTFMDYEKNILELLSSQKELILIQNFFKKIYLLLNVQDYMELEKLIDMSDFQSNYLIVYAKRLEFPTNRAFTILESIILDLIGLKAREVHPLNKLKKFFDLK